MDLVAKQAEENSQMEEVKISPSVDAAPTAAPKSVRCPICASAQIKTAIARAPDHIRKENFSILSCANCQVCFTYPVPDDMEPYYPEKYRGYGPLVKGLLQMFYRFRVSGWVKRFNQPGKALEIGCGSGMMLSALKRKGWDVVGIERTESAAAYARDTLGLNIISRGIEEVAREPHFDLIILFNALEHIVEPLSVLKECALRLKPDGLLVINVPNFNSWQARFNSHLWLHLDPPRHLFHFTPESLANILAMAGLTAQSVRFVSLEHDPFGWIQSSINKIICSPNNLTRYLMGMERFNFRIIVSIILGFLMVIPAIFLSLASWLMKKGAQMAVVAVLSGEDKA